MKIKIQTFRVSFWAILGVAVLLTNLALHSKSQIIQDPTATPLIQTGTVDVSGETQEGKGSTDWIMLVAVVIVLIVIVPILLKRWAWENGKQDRTASPR